MKDSSIGSRVIFSTGGQIAQNMTIDLKEAGLPLLGTAMVVATDIEALEDYLKPASRKPNAVHASAA